MYRDEQKKIEQFSHGDIIRVISREENCGLDRTVFTAIVVDTKKKGMIAIPQDFMAHMFNSEMVKGASWEIELTWLLQNNVTIQKMYPY